MCYGVLYSTYTRVVCHRPVALIQGRAPGVFRTYFYNYNHTRRLRLKKLLLLELSRSPGGYFKPFLDPDGGFPSETATRRFQNRKGRYETVSEVRRLKNV